MLSMPMAQVTGPAADLLTIIGSPKKKQRPNESGEVYFVALDLRQLK